MAVKYWFKIKKMKIIQASGRLGIISFEEAGQGNVQEIVAKKVARFRTYMGVFI